MIKIDRNLSELWQIVCNVKHQLFLSDFNENLDFFDIFAPRQSNAQHHKEHHVHLLHVLLPQHRNWASGF